MDKWLTEYMDILENLNADNLDSLRKVTAESVHFKDPFNDTNTQQDFISIMQDMFQNLSNVRFDIHRSSQFDNEAFIHWTFYGQSKITGAFDFEGVSLIKVDSSHKVILHHDFWDGSVLMQKIPILGGVIRLLRNKLSHH